MALMRGEFRRTRTYGTHETHEIHKTDKSHKTAPLAHP